MSARTGRLPSGWETEALETVCSRVSDGTHFIPKFVKDGIPFVTVRHIDKESIDFESTDRIAKETYEELRGSYQPRDGDVLFSKDGTVGKVDLVEQPPQYIVLSSLAILRPESEALDSRFLSHVLSSPNVLSQAISRKPGTAIRRIILRNLRKVTIPIPPLAEQRRIVAKIEALQERSRRAREALSEVAPLLEQFRPSVLAVAFRGDLTADWRAAHPDVKSANELLQRIRAERRRQWDQAELAKYEAKGQKPPQTWKEKYREPEPVDDSDLPELPEGWIWATIDEISSHIVDCPHSTPQWTGVGKLCVRTTEFHPGKFDLTKARSVSLETFNERIQRLKPQPGDVLYSREGGILGLSCQVPADTELCLGQQMMLMRTDVHFLSGLLIHWLNSPRTLNRVGRLTLGSAAPHLNVGEVKRFPVPVAPIEEQWKLLEMIEYCLAIPEVCAQMAMDYEQQLDRLDQSILAKAFRGELVPQDSSEEPASALLERIGAQRKQQAEAPKQASKSHRTSKSGKKSPSLEPQQLVLAEVLRTAD